MTHMARFAFEALGIELTGQPDTSANNANEMKSRTMKKLLAHHTGSLMKRLLIGSLAAAAVVLGVAPVAHADSSWTMPNLIGRDLQGAQDAIQSLTHDAIWYSGSTDLTGKGRAQILDRNRRAQRGK